MPPAASSSRCWIQRDFLKEKLRVKERYWHPIENGDAKKERSLQDNDDHAASPRDLPRRWIIPDALAWRKYLSLILYLMEREHQQEKPPSTRWILLESVAEWMDYRNMSTNMIDKDNNNTIQSFPEKAAPQERLKLQKLMQQRPTRYQTIFDIFCDLSFREGDDEWEPMNYEDMTTVKRSQNALFRAARLLQQYHSQGSAPEIWILSGDIDFVQRFPEEDGIRTILVTDMLERDWFRHDDDEGSLFHLAEHAKRLATRCEEEYASRNKAATATSDSETDDTYTGVQDYWTEDAIQQGLHNKTLVKGRLSVTKENPKEGAVQSGDSSYFINQQHRGYFNRALHHDVVVVQPLPKHLWTSPVGKRRLVPIRNDDNDILDDEGVAAEDDDGNPPIPSGRVVAIVQESRRQFVATMVNTPMNDESACLVVPMDVRIPKIRIKTSGWQRFVGNRLLVQVDSWDVDSTFPSGHCVDILGPIADLETEIACLLKENQIYLEPFSAAAMADLPLEGHDWKIPDVEIAARRDLRSMRIFSVDPNGCQDIDDTMHARVLPTGDIEIGVHIADVTYFVPHNSALDKEAQVRGTTFYLVDRRFDMLPSVLSSDLCSLHGNMDRLAVSTIWTFSGDFETVKDFWYGRSVIHNVQAMTYEQAHNILHDLPPDDPSKPSPPPLTAGYPVAKSNIGPLKEDLATLTKLARFLRKDREDVGGAVDLSSGDQGNELKFLLDSNGSPVRVTPKKQMEVHHTVAELMILANTYVARTIYDSFPESALLRIHQSVDESRFEDLKEVLQAGNICFDGSSNMRLAGSLKVAETKTNSAVSSLFQSLATRAMSEAQYVSTGEIKGEVGLSHYGLGLEKYTHFTSPIRRYADVVVHHQLLLTLSSKSKQAVPPPPPGFNRGPLPSLPKSETISVLRGDEAGTETMMPEMAESDSSDNSTQVMWHAKNSLALATITSGDKLDLYSNSRVSRICGILNQQNRMAKLSSFECQNLFLSLYFKEKREVTQAVVTSLRSNGFFAYVPRFDFRAPVYLSDRNGDLQIDPTLLQLDASSGLPPTAGFAMSSVNRKFPTGKCSLEIINGKESLNVTVPDSQVNYLVKVLDVVTVTICCDDWDAKSRVPQPRIYLIADTSTKPKPVQTPSENVVPSLSRCASENLNPFNMSTQHDQKQKQSTTLSVYEEMTSLITPPVLDVGFRTYETNRKPRTTGESIIPGRMIFCKFVNPDTRSAQQEASILEASEAAAERRNQILEARARQGEYDATKQIEKDVTARMQRLAVNKRNTKRGKNK